MAKTVTVDPEVAKKDTNGDGHISKQEMEMDLEFKRKELEDADARRDAMRQMAWFSLFGMLLYPFAVVLANWVGLGKLLMNKVNNLSEGEKQKLVIARSLVCKPKLLIADEPMNHLDNKTKYSFKNSF